MGRWWLASIIALSGAMLFATASPVAAQATKTLISAEEVVYDDELGIIVARGNVELIREGRILLADTVTYNERDDIAVATGNVALVERTGEVLFADYVKLTNDLKEGLIQDFRFLDTDNTRVAAAAGAFIANKRQRLRKVVMSPCNLCAEDPTRAPVWQVKAEEALFDEEEETWSYRDVVLEMFGIPVFYTPYYAHAAPEVKRKSGFLTPTPGFDSELGYNVRIPYFWEIAPDQDMTFTPIVTTNERVALLTEYRRHFGDGYLEVEGSGTYVSRRNADGDLVDGNELRGHVRGFGRFDINNNWRWGFDVERATDRTYLRRYGFESPTTLVSRGFVEGFDDRDYAELSTIFFQGQRAGDTFGDTPIVAPSFVINLQGTPDGFGGRWGLDASLLNIIRTESANTKRLAVRGEWVLPYTFENGQVVTLTASVLGAAYYADILTDPMDPFGPSTAETEYRIYPQLVAEWRYPFVRRGEDTTQIIEPVVALFVAPDDPNDSDIPNEDSRDLEFSDASLFSDNRFSGIDFLDGGQRLVYGIDSGFYWGDAGYAKLFVGQSYRIGGDTMFTDKSGLEGDMSDFVARIQIRPQEYVTIGARARINETDFAPRQIDIDSDFDFTPFRFGIDYTFVAETTGLVSFDEREEISAYAEIDVGDYWRFRARHRHDLTTDAGPLRSTFEAHYVDECFEVAAIFERRFFEDADVSADNRFLLEFTYKHLGTIGTGQI